MVKLSKDVILKLRAEALALKGIESEQREGSLETVLFSLSNEKYAIESVYVREAYALKDVTQLPCVPPFVMGIIQVRRKIYSVIDFRKLFDLEENTSGCEGIALILEKDKMAFGILVEKILGLKEMFQSELQSPLPSMTGIFLEFVKGISKDKIIVLDGSKILHSSSLLVE